MTQNKYPPSFSPPRAWSLTGRPDINDGGHLNKRRSNPARGRRPMGTTGGLGSGVGAVRESEQLPWGAALELRWGGEAGGQWREYPAGVGTGPRGWGR